MLPRISRETLEMSTKFMLVVVLVSWQRTVGWLVPVTIFFWYEHAMIIFFLLLLFNVVLSNRRFLDNNSWERQTTTYTD